MVVTYFRVVPRVTDSLMVPRNLVFCPENPTKVIEDGVKCSEVSPMTLKAL